MFDYQLRSYQREIMEKKSINKIINKFKHYEFKCNEWHRINCAFIECDWGVCNCKDIRKKLVKYLEQTNIN